jgi:hypothetical protein
MIAARSRTAQRCSGSSAAPRQSAVDACRFRSNQFLLSSGAIAEEIFELHSVVYWCRRASFFRCKLGHEGYR